MREAGPAQAGLVKQAEVSAREFLFFVTLPQLFGKRYGGKRDWISRLTYLKASSPIYRFWRWGSFAAYFSLLSVSLGRLLALCLLNNKAMSYGGYQIMHTKVVNMAAKGGS